MKLRTPLSALLSLILLLSLPSWGLAAESSNESRRWIVNTSGHAGNWHNVGTLKFPSGKVFIGDPSWGDDYHLRGTETVGATEMDVWLMISDTGKQVHHVWLEANGNLPSHIAKTVDFGTDSAYFAMGDLSVGQELADIGDLGISEYPDSFEFFLPHIQKGGFTSRWLDVPPRNEPVLAISTNRDGGLRAAWLQDRDNNFSGILIDISGQASDQQSVLTLFAE